MAAIGKSAPILAQDEIGRLCSLLLVVSSEGESLEDPFDSSSPDKEFWPLIPSLLSSLSGWIHANPAFFPKRLRIGRCGE
jgi:hypothetical protein